MDKIAIISDIHGNMIALEAVLMDIRNRDISQIYCLGDMVGKGPESDRVIDVCRNECEKIVLGNWDDLMLSDDLFPAAIWHQEKIGKERIDYIRTLPNKIDIKMSGRQIRLFHASQESVHHRVRSTDNTDVHMKMFDNTDFTGNLISPDVVGYGDIHVAYLRNYGKKTLFNMGSVGNPLGSIDASYCVIEGVLGSSKPGKFAINIVNVPYDIEKAIDIATDQSMPDLHYFSSELRTGVYRGNFKN